MRVANGVFAADFQEEPRGFVPVGRAGGHDLAVHTFQGNPEDLYRWDVPVAITGPVTPLRRSPDEFVPVAL
ncbi:hypothetical protein [Kamptonema formosum]|uniref:hypothetical protein n=1 Tax=Kamptonema formosum TaxID=331992 RepID=UPI00034B6302|nr:hypothetical protein [Oscillatoria sp. PCC 10802]